jgi:hypothetical protein
MDGHPGRLVDDDDLVIGIEHFDFGRGAAAGRDYNCWHGWGTVDFDPVAGANSVGGVRRRTI